MNKSRLLAAFSACVISLFSYSTNATLVVVDDPVFGVGSIMQDTDSGLEWLALNQTAGQSFNQVSAELGGLYAGFSYATRASVLTLFTNAGIPDVDVGSGGTASNVTAVSNLMSLWNADIWGINDINGQFGYFYTADIGTGLLWVPGSGNTEEGNAEATSGTDRINAYGNPDHIQTYLGSALVRDISSVPVPAAVWLFGSGLLGLIGFATRKNKCRCR